MGSEMCIRDRSLANLTLTVPDGSLVVPATLKVLVVAIVWSPPSAVLLFII